MSDFILPPNDILREMYERDEVQMPDGTSRRLHSAVHPEFAMALYNTVRREKPELVVEIGMAFAGSTLSILSALEENRKGRVVSIDPGQTEHFGNGGLHNVERSNLRHRHELMEEPSYLALPRLIDQGARVDMGYIDGMHTFDYTLVDFFS